MLLKGSTSAIFEVFWVWDFTFSRGTSKSSWRLCDPNLCCLRAPKHRKRNSRKSPRNSHICRPPDNYRTRLTGPDKIENFRKKSKIFFSNFIDVLCMKSRFWKFFEKSIFGDLRCLVRPEKMEMYNFRWPNRV